MRTRPKEHVPQKLKTFAKRTCSSLEQEHFLIVRTIPSERKGLNNDPRLARAVQGLKRI
jgi:hypothetical protein